MRQRPRTTATPSWVPDGRRVVMAPAGERWDAVSVPDYLGEGVLDALGKGTGAVLVDSSGVRLCWFTLPGRATTWVFPSQARVQIYGVATHVAVPGLGRTEAPKWRVPPTPARCLTDAIALHNALSAAVPLAPSTREGEPA